MAKESKDVWLKVLIGFIITVMGLTAAWSSAGMSKLDDKKVDKEVFNQHEKYQAQQYKDIKGSLERIESKL